MLYVKSIVTVRTRATDLGNTPTTNKRTVAPVYKVTATVHTVNGLKPEISTAVK